MEKPPKEYVEFTPKSELEQTIAKKLNWDGYVFQLPAYYKQQTLKIPVLNEKGKWVHVEKTYKQKPVKLPPIEELHVTCSEGTIKQRIVQAMNELQLPVGFKKQFPYLYAILHDQVSIRVVEQSRGQYYQKIAYLYREMAQQLITVMVQVFDMIMNRMFVEVPELVNYFERHPEDMVLLNIMKTMIAPFVDPQLMKKDKLILVPEPPKGLLQDALNERKSESH